MANLSELLNSKKVSTFVRKEKSRPWTIDRLPFEVEAEIINPVITESQLSQNQVTNPVITESQLSQNQVTEILTKSLQKSNPVITESPTRSRFETNPVTTESKPGHKIRDYKTLVGNDRNVMLALFLDARQQGSTKTSTFSRATLAARLGLSYEAVRSSIKRLLQFGILEKVESSKGGPGAWVLVRFSQRVFQEINLTESQLSQNQVTNPVKSESQLSHQPGQTSSSSSSFVLNKDLKTTTDEPELINDGMTQLSPEWRLVDVTPLAEIGFTQTHLLQIIRQGKLSASEVQDSIHFFAFDLKRNGKGKELNGPPLNYFMGILRKCIPYAPPENFESPADEARRRTREFKERKERERQTEEQQLLNLDFTEWRRGLPESEVLKILPEFARNPGPIQDSALKEYFKTNIYKITSPDEAISPVFNEQQIRSIIKESLGDIRE